jgi:hypothetical protein
MNKHLKKYVYKVTKRLENKLLKVIKAFPNDKDWGSNHLDIAVRKLVENPELSTKQVINHIKRSYLCHHEGWFVDKGKKLTIE